MESYLENVWSRRALSCHFALALLCHRADDHCAEARFLAHIPV